jgi:hypothetical protein
LACRGSFENKKRREATVAKGGNSVGQPFQCEECGTETIRNSAYSKFCPDCRPKLRAAANATWRANNLERINERKANYRKDPRYNLDNRMGCAIWQCLREEKDGWRWEDLVGYTLDELMRQLERQFVGGMGWHNIEKWHVDHIVPKSFFSYKTPDCPDFKRAWAITNLRPLWKTDNLKKGAKRLFLV